MIFTVFFRQKKVRIPMESADQYNACNEAAHAKVELLKKDLGI